MGDAGRAAGAAQGDRQPGAHVSKNLEDTKGLAKEMLDRLYELIHIVQSYKQTLDAEFPRWRRERDKGTHYLGHDARLEFFNSLRVVLENAQISYMNLHDNVSNPEWYERKGQSLSIAKIESVAKEQRIMINWFSFHSSAMIAEDTLRSIVRSDRVAFTVGPTAELKSVADHLLERVGLSEIRPLFELVRNIRNTIHNNGRHTEVD